MVDVKFFTALILTIAITTTQALSKENNKNKNVPEKTVDSVCNKYTGETITASSFDDAVAPLENMTPKSEFETTAQFKEREKKTIEGMRLPLVILKNIEDIKHLPYDADSGELTIKPYALSNKGMDFFSAFYSAGLYGKFKFGTSFNISTVISMEEKITGTYEATNGFGAKTQVANIYRETKAIFDHEGDYPHYSLFPGAEKAPYEIGRFKMSPDEVQKIRPLLKAAFIVMPKEPYLVTGTHSPGKVTIQNPLDITEKFRILVADIRCALLIDGSNKVIGSYKTR